MRRLNDRTWPVEMSDCAHTWEVERRGWIVVEPHLGTAAEGVVCLACGRLLTWDELLLALDRPLDKVLELTLNRAARGERARDENRTEARLLADQLEVSRQRVAWLERRIDAIKDATLGLMTWRARLRRLFRGA